jgi:hypothetical protein
VPDRFGEYGAIHATIDRMTLKLAELQIHRISR